MAAVFIVSVLFTGSVYAQSQAAKSGTQQASVAQPQTNAPEVKTIFSYKKELAITDSQEKELKDVLTRFQDNLVEKRKELNKLSAELADMIKSKDNLRSIRAKIDSIARIRADASYLDVETSRNVEDALTKDQLSKWKKIQEDVQKSMKAKK